MKNRILAGFFISPAVKCTGITPLPLGEGIMDMKVFMIYWEQSNGPLMGANMPVEVEVD